MSREPSPELRAAAEQLFAACRRERPSAELERRIAALGTGDREHSVVRTSVGRERAKPFYWLMAAIVLSCGAVAAWLSQRIEPPPIAISAERRPAPIEHPAAPVATSSAPAPVEREAAPLPVASAPIQSPARVKTRAPAPSAVPSSPRPAEPTPARPSLAQDLQELMRVRNTLRAGDGTGALELLDQRSTAGGELDAEATLLRIEALASVGRHEQASELARRFVASNPNSALADRAKAFVR